MALMRRSPTRGIFDVQDDFERMFDRLMRPLRTPETLERGTFRPVIDMEEHDDEYVVTAEMPGMDEDSIHLSVRNNTLTIRGEKEATTDKEEGESYYRERRYGSFQRSINFEKGIDAERVDAEYTNGVLHISLPKTEKEIGKEIPVNVKK